MSSATSAPSTTDQGPRVIGAVSVVLCGVVAFLILGPRPEGVAGAIDVSGLPLVNASLNALTALLLLAGYVAVKSGRKVLHRRLMLSAFGASTAFLTTYVVYHWFSVGPTPYTGAYRGFYLAMLASHILLAAIILPLALNTLWRGWTDRIASHRRIAPTTLWLWLYVSATGVLIYWMLHG